MVMRKQVHNYIQRKLQQSAHETETLQDFALVASLKALVMDVDAMKEKEIEMQRELSEQISASLSDLHHFIALLLSGDGDEEKSRFLLKTTLPFRPEGNTYFETPITARCSCCSRLARPIEPTPAQSPRSILVPTPRTHSIFTHSTLKSPRALDGLVCRSTTEIVPTTSRTSSSSSQCLTLNV